MENCKKCGREKEMYYSLWCPKCDKPEVENKPTLNLIKCLRYLEVNGREGIKDRLWDFFGEYINNNSTFYFDLEMIDYEDEGSEVREDLLLIEKTWDIKYGIEMYVSW